MSEKFEAPEVFIVTQPRRRSIRYYVFNGLKILLAIFLVGQLLRTLSSFSTTDDVNGKELYLDTLKLNLAGNWSEKYTSEPHLPGTNYGFVEWTKQKFEEYGLKGTVDTYDIFVSYPKDHDLNLLDAKTNEVLYNAPLKEDELKKDKTSKGDDRVPTFLAYSANGNVTGEYVYVNYGTIGDYETLRAHGVDVKGKIVVARYGGIFRGLKVKFAQENGAIGVLLYTDPSEDDGITPANGYKQYPHGPARHESAVQRGSVQFLGGSNSAPGDPTTPGYPSKPGVERKSPYDSIGKIPALPISYREVKPILEKLNGHGARIKDKSWKGELEGFDYSTGPNKNVTLNLYNNQDYKITPLWNVYGEIEGENKNEVIVIGNHRDAWIKGGAGDPNSGSAALIELARGLGALKEAGYKFKRSIILQSYDGEEYGLLGSTEQGEFFADEIQRKVVAYLNLDVATVGKFLNLAASPLLNTLILETAKELKYPVEGEGTLYDHFVKESKGQIGVLGSGSDYTVYLEHLGVPSLDLSFSGGKNDPVYQYHSNYDSYYWMSKFGDPGFVYHNLAAKYLGLLTLNLESDPVIPLSLSDYAVALSKYFKEAVSLAPKEWLEKTTKNKEVWDELLATSEEDALYNYKVTDGVYMDIQLFPFPEWMIPRGCRHNKALHMFATDSHQNVTLRELIQGTASDLKKLEKIAEGFDFTSQSFRKEKERDDLSWWRRIRLHFRIVSQNKHLQYFERNFLNRKGLHERPWFKHIVFVAGRKTGYAGQTLPALKEAAEDGDFDRYVTALGVLAKTVRKVLKNLD